MIHSLDSERLALEIEKQAAKHSRVIDVLIEVNVGDEASKGGVTPSELESLLAFTDKLEHVRCRGIMVIPPSFCDGDQYTEYFTYAADLARNVFGEREFVLSMGMSDSYVPAVKFGSDIIRVGSSLFGERDYTNK